MKLEEIARLAGVSRTTASYVINGKAEQHRISAATRERVMAIVDQYQYRPDQAATALRLGSSRLLGFVLPDLRTRAMPGLPSCLSWGLASVAINSSLVAVVMTPIPRCRWWRCW